MPYAYSGSRIEKAADTTGKQKQTLNTQTLLGTYAWDSHHFLK
jgi:hypothetical protein